MKINQKDVQYLRNQPLDVPKYESFEIGMYVLISKIWDKDDENIYQVIRLKNTCITLSNNKTYYRKHLIIIPESFYTN